MKLKILSYNIHKGFDWSNKKYGLESIKKLIKDSGAELIFLQEVIGENDNIKLEGLVDNQFEYLADSLFPHYSYAQNAISDHGHHGNLILSKYPIMSFKNINISTNVLEKRGMLVCSIEIPPELNCITKNILACCVHLNLLHSGRKKQYLKITDFFNNQMNKSPNDLMIIAGDFNDWNKKSFQTFENILDMKEAHKTIHGNYAKTFPSHLPILSLDRIYVKNITVLNSKTIIGDDHLSDHLPLFCEVEIK